jgi:hypothetical protein
MGAFQPTLQAKKGITVLPQPITCTQNTWAAAAQQYDNNNDDDNHGGVVFLGGFDNGVVFHGGSPVFGYEK